MGDNSAIWELLPLRGGAAWMVMQCQAAPTGALPIAPRRAVASALETQGEILLFRVGHASEAERQRVRRGAVTLCGDAARALVTPFYFEGRQNEA